MSKGQVDPPEVAAAKVAKWRAAGMLPEQGKSTEFVANLRANGKLGESTVTFDETPLVVECVHRGEVIRMEPCHCGAASKLPVHQCLLDEHKRSSGAFGLCVETAKQLGKIKDKDARQSLLCCETCPLRQPGDAQNSAS